MIIQFLKFFLHSKGTFRATQLKKSKTFEAFLHFFVDIRTLYRTEKQTVVQKYTNKRKTITRWPGQQPAAFEQKNDVWMWVCVCWRVINNFFRLWKKYCFINLSNQHTYLTYPLWNKILHTTQCKSYNKLTRSLFVKESIGVDLRKICRYVYL